MDNRTQKLIRAVLESQDYRDFLSKLFIASSKEAKKFNYAAFSRKAGFTSRSFVREVVDGRKRLTSFSFPKFLKALSLPVPLRNYFTYLVWLEESELNHDKLSSEQIHQKIEEIRQRLSQSLLAAENSNSISTALFKSYQVLEVYSALASRGPGTELSEVESTTGYETRVCLQVLRYLVSQKVVLEQAGKFKALNPHAVYSSVGTEDGIKTVFLDSLSVLKRKATSRWKGEDQLYSQSFFSVPRKRLPELRKRLRDVLHEFIETYETDEGDCIGKLLVGFYS